MYEVNYHISRGEVWERLIIPKDRRTHRRRVPTEAAATVLIAGVKFALPVNVTFEGGVRIYLTPAQTEWLPEGIFPWDMVVTVSRSPYFVSTQLAQTLVVHGTITVTTYDNITPMLSDGVTAPLAVVT